MSCPRSLVADGPFEAHALLALEEALRVDLGLDRLQLREVVRAPGVFLQRDALLLALGVRVVARTEGRVVVLEGPERVAADVVELRAPEDFAVRGLRVERRDLGEKVLAGESEPAYLNQVRIFKIGPLVIYHTARN